MLKMQASFQKKVPAESNFSSQSYHCTIEVELPDGLSHQQLQEKVHGVFDFVRAAVEHELQNAPSSVQPVQAPVQTAPLQTNGSAQLPPAQPQMQQQAPMPPQPAPMQQQMQPVAQQSMPRGNGNGFASAKQRNYLLALVKRAGWTVPQLLQHCQIASIEQLPSRTCSELIQQFSGQAA